MRGIPYRLHPERIRRTLGAATCVSERTRFVVNELRDVPVVGRYRLRETGLLAEIRHPLLDMWVLEEVFRFRVYEPPAPVRSSLAGLGRPLRILDLGGHIGCFALFMRGLFPSARVVSLEPDPANASILRSCIDANGLRDSWELIEACAATRDGTAELLGSFHLSQMSGGSEQSLRRLQQGIVDRFPFLDGTPLVRSERREVACRDVFGLLLDADLVKFDIEGAEWPILADPRFRELQATAVVLEYHPSYVAEPGPERTVEGALRGAGYATERSARGVDGGTTWAWKPGGRTS